MATASPRPPGAPSPSPPDEGRSASRRPTARTSIRVGLGIVWALNLLYILDPANQFFGTFSQTAQSYAPTSLGGPGFADLVAANPLPFAVLIAALTSYLAIAFLSGRTLRAACGVGLGFNSALLLTQFASVTTIPGGTDVGPMPLYLVLYLALLLDPTGRPSGPTGTTASARLLVRARAWGDSRLTPARSPSLRPGARSEQSRL